MNSDILKGDNPDILDLLKKFIDVSDGELVGDVSYWTGLFIGGKNIVNESKEVKSARLEAELAKMFQIVSEDGKTFIKYKGENQEGLWASLSRAIKPAISDRYNLKMLLKTILRSEDSLKGADVTEWLGKLDIGISKVDKELNKAERFVATGKDYWRGVGNRIVGRYTSRNVLKDYNQNISIVKDDIKSVINKVKSFTNKMGKSIEENAKAITSDTENVLKEAEPALKEVAVVGEKLKPLGQLTKRLGIIGDALMIGSDVYGAASDPKLSTEQKVGKAAIDIGVDAGSIVAATETGAFIGSFIPVPIVGTAVGACAGAIIGVLINVKFFGGKSLVDKVKGFFENK